MRRKHPVALVRPMASAATRTPHGPPPLTPHGPPPLTPHGPPPPPPHGLRSYENLLETGVIDPATVTQQAVLNSASIAASIITTSALITEVKEKEPVGGAMPVDDGMGGMTQM
jgi:hypothetical protein